MYNSSMEDNIPNEYEEKIQQLQKHIYKLQSKIDQLEYENTQLRNQLQKSSDTLTAPKHYFSPHIRPQALGRQVQPPAQVPPPVASPQMTPPPSQYASPPPSSNAGGFTNKRKCPVCGVMGFNIKEFDDKSKIISFIPRRIYAKKRVCTKCMHEF